MVRATRSGEQLLTLPYGPTKGMLQALQLMRKSTPHRVDGNFLRLNKIAPGNEYKVVGALRFLGIIDDEGRPTERSRVLKTKGSTFVAALQDIIRNAYKSLFQHIGGNGHSQEDIYNYFITTEGLGPEMASKTTRFFVQLCQMAEIDLGFNSGRERIPDTSKRGRNGCHKDYMEHHPHNGSGATVTAGALNGFPIILAITPAMASMETDELAEFLKKLKTAWAKANED